MTKEGAPDIPYLPDVYHSDEATVQQVANDGMSEPGKGRRSKRMTKKGRPEARDIRRTSVPKWLLDHAIQEAGGDRNRVVIDPHDGLPVILNNPRVPPVNRRYGQDIWRDSPPEPEPPQIPEALAQAALSLAAHDKELIKYVNESTILIENYPGQSDDW